MKAFRFVDILRSLFAYFVIGCGVIFLVIPCMILLAFFPQRYAWRDRVVFKLLHALYWLSLKGMFLPIEIKGKEHIPAGAAIYVANHQSALDIPAVGYILDGKPQVWFALEYYAHKPFLGFFIRHIGVAIDRDDPHKAARSLIKALKILDSKPYNFIIFPEGRRYNDGKVHEFLQGYVVVAKKTGLPVVPVYMPNNGLILPPETFWGHYYPLVIVVGEPFSYTQEDTDETFAQRVYVWFLAQQTQQ